MSDDPEQRLPTPLHVAPSYKVQWYNAKQLHDASFHDVHYLDYGKCIPWPARVLVWGAQSSLKTWFTLQKLVEIASGGGVAGPMGGTNVAAMIGEGNRKKVRERLERLAHAFGCRLPYLWSRLRVTYDRVWLESPTGAAVLNELLEGRSGGADDFEWTPRVLLIDPLISYFGLNENDVKDVKQLLVRLDRLVEAGVTVMLVHHGNKGNAEGRRQIRGSTAWEAWADVVYMFDRQEDGSTKMVQTKNRDDESLAPREYRLVFDDELNKVELIEEPPEVKEAAKSKQRDDVLVFITNQGGTGALPSQIRTATSCNGVRLKRVLDSLMAENLVRAEDRVSARGRKYRAYVATAVPVVLPIVSVPAPPPGLFPPSP